MKMKNILMLGILPFLLSSCDSPFDKVKPLLETNTKWSSEDGMIIFYAETNNIAGRGKIFIKDQYEPFLWTYTSGKMNIDLNEGSFQTSFSVSAIRGSFFRVDQEKLKISANSPYADPSFENWNNQLLKDKLSYFDK